MEFQGLDNELEPNELPYNMTGDPINFNSSEFMFRFAIGLIISCSFFSACVRTGICQSQHSITIIQRPIMRQQTSTENLQRYLLDHDVPEDTIDTESKDINETCAICIEPLKEGDTSIVLKCNHVFHKDCIISWFKKELICPICRSPVN